MPAFSIWAFGPIGKKTHLNCSRKDVNIGVSFTNTFFNALVILFGMTSTVMYMRLKIDFDALKYPIVGPSTQNSRTEVRFF